MCLYVQSVITLRFKLRCVKMRRSGSEDNIRVVKWRKLHPYTVIQFIIWCQIPVFSLQKGSAEPISSLDSTSRGSRVVRAASMSCPHLDVTRTHFSTHPECTEVRPGLLVESWRVSSALAGLTAFFTVSFPLLWLCIFALFLRGDDLRPSILGNVNYAL